MKIRKVFGVLIISIVVIMASFVAAVPAFAEKWDEWMYTDDSNPGGKVEFKKYGDVVKLSDIQKDGYAVHLEVYDVQEKKLKYNYTIGGAGKSQTFSASLGGKYDLAEGHVFRFTISLVKNGKHYFSDTAYWDNNN